MFHSIRASGTLRKNKHCSTRSDQVEHFLRQTFFIIITNKTGWQFLSLLLTTGYIVLAYIEEYYPSPIIWAFLSLLHIAQFIWLVTVKRGAGYLDPDVTQNVVGQSAHAMPPHYCKNSKMYLPRRAKYCNKCGYCVLTFDHHCFWIGGCVGEFNHRSFFAFLYVLN